MLKSGYVENISKPILCHMEERCKGATTYTTDEYFTPQSLGNPVEESQYLFRVYLTFHCQIGK